MLSKCYKVTYAASFALCEPLLVHTDTGSVLSEEDKVFPQAE